MPGGEEALGPWDLHPHQAGKHPGWDEGVIGPQPCPLSRITASPKVWFLPRSLEEHCRGLVNTAMPTLLLSAEWAAQLESTWPVRVVRGWIHGRGFPADSL